MSRTILLVEDDDSAAKLLAFNLQVQGYRPIIAPDALHGLRAAESAALILLDLCLPDMDGLEFCRLLRRESATPILMLTGRCGDAARVTGLDQGADDYLEKPFSLTELFARIRALLRRSSPDVPCAEVTLQPDRCAVRVGTLQIPLTKTEFALFSFLAKRDGQLFTREELLQTVWGFSAAVGGERGVDVTMARIRAKFGGHTFPIRTVRGAGYRFEAPK